MAKMMKVIAMNTPESSSMLSKRARIAGRDELRQEGDEEDRQFRVEDVHQHAVDDDPERRALVGAGLDLQRAVLAQRLPGHVEQVGDAGIFHDLEGERAGVEQRRKAGQRGDQMRHDAERAGKRREHAGAPSAREARRQRIDDAGSGRCDDDQRGEEEFDAHA